MQIHVAAVPAHSADETIAGALLGAAITAFVTLAIFIVDRIIRTMSAIREARRVAFAEIFSAVGEWIAEAQMSNGTPDGVKGALVVVARSRMTVSLGIKYRTVGVWLTGLEYEIAEVAAAVAENEADRDTRGERLDQLSARIFNALIDLQQGRLFLSDFTLPSAVLELKREVPGYATENRELVEWATQVRSGGRYHALRSSLSWFRRAPVRWARSWKRSPQYVPPPTKKADTTTPAAKPESQPD